MNKPAIGRIVIFTTAEGTHLAAVVTNVWGPDCVNLKVHRDEDLADLFVSSAVLGTPTQPLTWHWPIIEKPAVAAAAPRQQVTAPIVTADAQVTLPATDPTAPPANNPA